MSIIEEYITTLTRPFPLEKKMKYLNLSVFGGFDSYVRHWIEMAKASTEIQDLRKKLCEVESLFEHYIRATFPERKMILDRSYGLLSEIINDSRRLEEESKSRNTEDGCRGRPGTAPFQARDKDSGQAETKRVIVERVKEKFIPGIEGDVQYAKGVGPGLAKKMKKMGIDSIEDLLYHFPRRYEDRSRLTPIMEVRDGEFETVMGAVIEKKDVRPRRGLTISRVTIHDGTAPLTLIWFNQPFRASQLAQGVKLYASGKVEKRFSVRQMNNPEYELVSDEDPLNTGRIVPVYPLTENLSQKVLRRIIKTNLDIHMSSLQDSLPLDLRRAYAFPDLAASLSAMHFPEDFGILGSARDRLAYEELFFLQLGLLLIKNNRTVVKKERHYKFSNDFISSFEEHLPFLFTGAQRKVLGDVMGDLRDSRPMSRLIQGDVGSGKTVVAACAIQAAVLSGFQGGVMAPTEILAEQHYKKFQQILAPAGIRVGLLIGSLRKKEKEKTHEAIKGGEVQVAIGTHALIQDEVFFDNLGLVVIDEQHRFGVMQRAGLQKKGTHPDMLVMTATPIPRTLALTLYGDLDISVINEMPPGRSKIISKWRRFREDQKVYEFIRTEIASGRQAYIVCPLIDESDKVEARAATKEMETLSTKYFSDVRVALLHGKMKGSEKEGIMRSFRDNEIDILISTTVIEVGVDVPNATVMVVLNADRFGLAQLHQLRGRVGRGSHQSYCFFIADPGSMEGVERMKALEKHDDGFIIAEKDLELRGPGDFYGTRQHGLPDLKVADLLRDLQVLEKARRDAQQLLEKQPYLISEPLVQKKLAAQFDSKWELFH